MWRGVAGAAQSVDPDEDVCRLCFAAELPLFREAGQPNQIDPETNLLRLAEIQWIDVSQKGCSLQRRGLYTLAMGEAEAQRRDEKHSTKRGQEVRYNLAGVLITEAENITRIVDENGDQVFGVLATPTDVDPAHAEVRIADRLSKSDFLKFRTVLRDALGPLREKELLDEH